MSVLLRGTEAPPERWGEPGARTQPVRGFARGPRSSEGQAAANASTSGASRAGEIAALRRIHTWYPPPGPDEHTRCSTPVAVKAEVQLARSAVAVEPA